eukprot:TRINITY_DN9528_c0_g2_i2.p1 TRINITY_DN9528_c0_g2~~TRINITY_DN9528_c0_g2_i2.p1  ORF type:complete len:257 (-),score=106.35 TRINITY_DN9528_c0_g2_i2:472-1242(-)
MVEEKKVDMGALTKQVEYYLSESNLKKDKYFNDLIRENTGYLPIEAILKCNKIKALTQNPKVITEAVKGSDKLELNLEETGVGRKGNPPVPELEKTGKRKEATKEDAKEDREYIKESDLNEPVVMGIEGPQEPKNNWRQIETDYKEKYPDRKVLYTRYDKGEGQIIVSSNKQDLTKLTEELKIKIGDDEFVVKKLEDEKLEKFWAEHGNHYNGCVNKKLSLSSNFPYKDIELKKKKADREKKNAKIAVKLGDTTYS